MTPTELKSINDLPLCWLDTADTEPEAQAIAQRNGVTTIYHVKDNHTYYIPRI